jgi:MerR family transcriptional regulator, redox-sensitive transcriptional activator SoxR
VADRDRLSISEVAHTTGLQSSALRYYEKVGLITSVARSGGRRQYDRSVLRRLAVIALLQEAGFTIAEVGQLLHAGTGHDTWRSMAEQKLAELDAHLARITAAREVLVAAVECDCAGLDTCELVDAREGRHRTLVQALSTPRRDHDL